MPCSSEIGWPGPFLRRSHKGELADNQGLASGFRHAEVHHPFSIVENPQRGNLPGQPVDVFLPILVPDSQKDEEAGTYMGFDTAVYRY